MRRLFSAVPVVFVGVALLATPTWSAGIGIDVTCSWDVPTDNVLVSHHIPYANFSWPCQWIDDTGAPDYGHLDLGQSFLISEANDVVLDKISLKMGWGAYGTGALNADYRLELWTVTDPLDSSGNTLVSSQNGTLPASASDLLTGGTPYGDSACWTFDIEDVYLETGNYYAFMFAFEDGPVPGRIMSFRTRWGDPYYLDGRMIIRTGTPAAWQYKSSNDLSFYIQGTPVPEPGTLTLVALGSLGLLLRRRKR